MVLLRAQRTWHVFDNCTRSYCTLCAATSHPLFDLQESLERIDPDVLGKVPLSYFLGTLGMPGRTVSVHVCSQEGCMSCSTIPGTSCVLQVLWHMRASHNMQNTRASKPVII